MRAVYYAARQRAKLQHYKANHWMKFRPGIGKNARAK